MTARVTLATLPAYARSMLAAAAAHAGRFPETHTFCLPGLRVIAELDHGILADAVAETFLQAGAGENVTGGHHEARFFVGHPRLSANFAPARWGEEIFHPHQFASCLAEHGLRGDYLHEQRCWQFYDTSSRIGVQLMTSRDGFPPWEPGAPLRPFLHWEYAARGMRLTHAGTLGRDGVGVLLAGGGGSGKSGTVVAGMLNGLDSVGDDYVLVDFHNGVTAFPLFATLKQDPAGFARLRLAEKLPGPRPLNWQGKHQFRIRDITSRPTPAKLSIRALMVPAVTGGTKTTITPLPRRQAMMALAPSGIAQMPGERKGGFRFFGRMTRLLPCYALSLGTQADEIATVIGEFLERGADESQRDHAGVQSRAADRSGAEIADPPV